MNFYATATTKRGKYSPQTIRMYFQVRLSVYPSSPRFSVPKWKPFALRLRAHRQLFSHQLSAIWIRLTFVTLMLSPDSSRPLLQKAATWTRHPPSWSRNAWTSCFLSSRDCVMSQSRAAAYQHLKRQPMVTPRLKKSSLDPAEILNYRPILNLPFMSKVIEKLILAQLSHYLADNNLFPKYQSGFRRYHSTETAILRVLSDIYSAIDQDQVSLLTLLDVSAAFDTVDHSILLERLSTSYGLTGTAFTWLESHITGRVQVIHVGGRQSTPAMVHFGVSQGSVLGPVLFVLYTADIVKLVESFGATSSSSCRWRPALWMLLSKYLSRAVDQSLPSNRLHPCPDVIKSHLAQHPEVTVQFGLVLGMV